MIRNKKEHADLVAAFCAEQISFLTDARDYMKSADFNELVVLLLIASKGYESEGISDREISDTLGISISTANRIVHSLQRSVKVVSSQGKRPRLHRFNYDFSEAVYGAEAPAQIEQYFSRTFNRRAQNFADIVRLLLISHFKK